MSNNFITFVFLIVYIVSLTNSLNFIIKFKNHTKILELMKLRQQQVVQMYNVPQSHAWNRY